jgi:hypothetical protein
MGISDVLGGGFAGAHSPLQCRAEHCWLRVVSVRRQGEGQLARIPARTPALAATSAYYGQ